MTEDTVTPTSIEDAYLDSTDDLPWKERKPGGPAIGFLHTLYRRRVASFAADMRTTLGGGGHKNVKQRKHSGSPRPS